MIIVTYFYIVFRPRILVALLSVIELPEDETVQHGEFANDDEEEHEHTFTSAAFTPLSYPFSNLLIISYLSLYTFSSGTGLITRLTRVTLITVITLITREEKTAQKYKKEMPKVEIEIICYYVTVIQIVHRFLYWALYLYIFCLFLLLRVRRLSRLSRV
jgi:hypothetical protein